MWEWVEQYREWFDVAVWAAAIVSVAGLLIVPWLIARIPADYFAEPEPPPLPWVDAHPVLRITLHVLKTLVGGVLFLAGIAMLVLPGQGILTVLVGLMLMDFPGKRRLEVWAVRRPGVLRALNWFRSKTGHAPLVVGDHV